MNQLMESLVLGGFSYEVAFSFSGVGERKQEKILKELGKVLNTKALNIASKILDQKGYDYYLKAVEVAEKRFLFYKKLLESEESRNKYLTQLGSDDLIFRIVFAMHGCIEHSNKILWCMDTLIGDLVSDSVSVLRIGYNRWAILNLKEPITKCKKVGVCICEGGDTEPYTNSCVRSDPTRILISKAEKQKRNEEFHKSFSEMIKKEK